MALRQLHLENFRNVAQLSVEFSDGFNYVVGENGSGKSSLLEAIHVLSHGRSFRSTAGHVVKHDQQAAVVRAHVQHADDATQLGWQRSDDGRVVCRRNEVNCSVARLAEPLPHIHLDTDTHRIFAHGPSARRKWLDWAMFHMEPSLHDSWRRYHRALKQRNAWLKGRPFSIESDPWLPELVEHGKALHDWRLAYVDQLTQSICQVLTHLDDAAFNLSCGYEAGWDSESGDLEAALTAQFSADVERGFTTVGPHRGDWLLSVDDKDAFNTLSQGQQKLLTFAVRMAQIQDYQERHRYTVLVTIDDLCAELDSGHRQQVAAFLNALNCQCIITGVLPRDMVEISAAHEGAWFSLVDGELMVMEAEACPA